MPFCFRGLLVLYFIIRELEHEIDPARHKLIASPFSGSSQVTYVEKCKRERL